MLKQLSFPPSRFVSISDLFAPTDLGTESQVCKGCAQGWLLKEESFGAVTAASLFLLLPDLHFSHL